MRIVKIILAVTLSLSAVSIITSSAHACQLSTWTKTSGNSFAATIRGRDCNGNMSVRMTGGFGDTGWLPMYKNGNSNFRAQYGDGQVLTDINMQVTGGTMNAYFIHKSATGISNTQGSYHLTGF